MHSALYLFFKTVDDHQICSTVSAISPAQRPRFFQFGEEITGTSELCPFRRASSLCNYNKRHCKERRTLFMQHFLRQGHKTIHKWGDKKRNVKRQKKAQNKVWVFVLFDPDSRKEKDFLTFNPQVVKSRTPECALKVSDKIFNILRKLGQSFYKKWHFKSRFYHSDTRGCENIL